MKKVILKKQLQGFLFVSILGVLLHFLYAWTGGNPFVAWFSAVNESTWEHMKILFFPMFLYAARESRTLFPQNPDFWCIKLCGTLLGTLLIPVLYYTLSGFFGTLPDFVNISIFFISAAAAFWWETKRFREGDLATCAPQAAFAVFLTLSLLFAVFTFFPPHLPVFKDPVTGAYGI